jgi:hypothetical protein
VTGELLCQCGCRIVEWVHGHGQCQNCGNCVFPCCSGEVADGLPGAAGDDWGSFEVVDHVFMSEKGVDLHFYAGNAGDHLPSSTRPCPCHGLLDLAYCCICGRENICESEPDFDDAVKKSCLSSAVVKAA